MNKDRKRKIFPQISQYQLRIVFVVFFLTLTMHMCLFTALSFMHIDLFQLLVQDKDAYVVGLAIDQWSVNILVMSGIFMAICLIGTYLISRNLVGSFGRIIREMDEVLAGERAAPITARKYDWLAQEVLKRVNAFIERSRS